MSDLAAAAEAMGIPETLVQRSAEARAAETDESVEEILASWAGGEASPAPAAAAEDGPPSEPETEAPPPEEEADREEPEGPDQEPQPDEPPAFPDTAEPAVPERATAPARTAPAEPPVLVGATDNPMTVMAGAIGLFLLTILVGLVGASVAEEPAGARTSDLDFSQLAEEGREIYVGQDCDACHTQMVRPVVADVGLGAVTLGDSDQVLGDRRYGPDLSDVGTRLTDGQLESVIRGLGTHPSHDLSGDDMAALVAYLAESRTSVPDEDIPEAPEDGGEPAEEGEPGEEEPAGEEEEPAGSDDTEAEGGG